MRTKTLKNVLTVLIALCLATMWFSMLRFDHSPVEKTADPRVPSSSRTSISRKKPRFFLHIGPHKSATTSIQCALHVNSDRLKADGVIFLGKIDGSFCGQKTTKYDRIRKIDECMQDDGDGGCWNNVTAEWHSYHRQGMDVILSKESLSDWMSSEYTWFWTKLARALKPWDVTILLTYRHYYQWLPSAYAQHAYHMIQINQPWPDELPVGFSSFLEQVLSGEAKPPYPYIDTVLQKKTSVVPSDWNFQLLNLHDGQDILTTLFCHVLHTASTCQNFETVGTKRTSQSEAVVIDRLNIAARINGWFAGGKRFARMKQTRKHVIQNDMLNQQNDKSLPVTDCPNHALLERFLAKSLLLQRQIIGDDKNENGLMTKEHIQGFWNATATFCSVNTSQVLSANSEAWRQLFSH